MPVVEIPVAARQSVSRSVRVTRVDNDAVAHQRALFAANNGACVAYIRNTVSDAIDSYNRLAALGANVELFHARFAMCDRLAIEKRILNSFGKTSAPNDRAGRIVVATQVIEQSLDLDFDLLISDLAPIDSIIQRAGRLGRHLRAERPVDDLELIIVSPEPTSDAPSKWYAAAFPKAAYVYAAHSLLWLTANILFRIGSITTPSDVRPMIEHVYGADARARVPVALTENYDAQEGRAFGELAIADNNLLSVSDGYQPGHRGWSRDVSTPTRLGAPSRSVRLAHWDGTVLTPYAGGSGRISDWLLSEVNVAERKCVRRIAFDDAELEAACRELEREWDDGSVVFPLLDDWKLEVFAQRGATVVPATIQYHVGAGLRV